MIETQSALAFMRAYSSRLDFEAARAALSEESHPHAHTLRAAAFNEEMRHAEAIEECRLAEELYESGAYDEPSPHRAFFVLFNRFRGELGEHLLLGANLNSTTLDRIRAFDCSDSSRLRRFAIHCEATVSIVNEQWDVAANAYDEALDLCGVTDVERPTLHFYRFVCDFASRKAGAIWDWRPVVESIPFVQRPILAGLLCAKALAFARLTGRDTIEIEEILTGLQIHPRATSILFRRADVITERGLGAVVY